MTHLLSGDTERRSSSVHALLTVISFYLSCQDNAFSSPPPSLKSPPTYCFLNFFISFLCQFAKGRPFIASHLTSVTDETKWTDIWNDVSKLKHSFFLGGGAFLRVPLAEGRGMLDRIGVTGTSLGRTSAPDKQDQLLHQTRAAWQSVQRSRRTHLRDGIELKENKKKQKPENSLALPAVPVCSSVIQHVHSKDLQKLK